MSFVNTIHNVLLLLVLTGGRDNLRLQAKCMNRLTVCVCVHVSHVPGMQVMVDEQSSTILTAGHPAAVGGMVTMETWRIGKFTMLL